MTQQQNSRPRSAETAVDAFYDVLLDFAWQPAVRMACDIEGASARCGRRACRTASRCTMSCAEGEPIACGGTTVGEETVLAAAAMAHFGCLMTMRYLHCMAHDVRRDMTEAEAPAEPVKPARKGRRRPRVH